MLDCTAAIQAQLDAIPSTGGSVYLPANGDGYGLIAPLRVGPNTLLHGDGQATLLQAMPGASFPSLLVNRDAQSRRSRVYSLRLSGNKANGAICGGIWWDHTGIGGAAHHRLFDVRVEDCAQNGITLIRTATVEGRAVQIEACDGHGLRIDGTSYDSQWDITVGNSGLHNVWTSAGAYFPWLHSYWSGKVNAVDYGDGLYIDGWANYGVVRGKIEDSFRHGLHLNGLGLPAAWVGWNIDVAFQEIEGDVVRLTRAHKTLVRGTAAGSTRRHADAVLNILDGLQNVINLDYDTDIVAPNAPVQGTTAGNRVSVEAF